MSWSSYDGKYGNTESASGAACGGCDTNSTIPASFTFTAVVRNDARDGGPQTRTFTGTVQATSDADPAPVPPDAHCMFQNQTDTFYFTLLCSDRNWWWAFFNNDSTSPLYQANGIGKAVMATDELATSFSANYAFPYIMFNGQPGTGTITIDGHY